MARVFTDVRVFPHVRGGSLCTWEIHNRFREVGPYQFQVQFSHSGIPEADDWKAAATETGAPGTTTYMAVDNLQRVWALSDRLWYRVRLVTGVPKTYYSEPQSVLGQLARHERLVARELLRKEDVRMRKTFAGTCGKLFKRKAWGTLCDREGCIDYDTLAVTNEICPRCMGTSYIGGYFPGIPYWMDFTPEPTDNIVQSDNLGATDMPRETEARAIACPVPKSGDFFWDQRSDRRWIIGNVGIAYAIRNVPLVCRISVGLVPPSDIIQEVPVG